MGEDLLGQNPQLQMVYSNPELSTSYEFYGYASLEIRVLIRYHYRGCCENHVELERGWDQDSFLKPVNYIRIVDCMYIIL